MSLLYDNLLLRLRTDAAAMVSKVLLVRSDLDAEAPVTPDEVHAYQARNSLWVARVHRVSYSGEPCPSEAEALCSLIETAHLWLGDDAPFHLLDQLDADRDALAAYRRVVPALMRATAKSLADALDELDMAGQTVDGHDIDVDVALARLSGVGAP